MLCRTGECTGSCEIAVSIGPGHGGKWLVLWAGSEHDRVVIEGGLGDVVLFAVHTGPVVLRSRQHHVRGTVGVGVDLAQ